MKMKSYLDLIPISGKIHRRQSRMVRICIALSVFLVTVLFGMADMEIRSQNIQAKINYGEWHMSVKGVTDETAELISLRPEVAACTRYNTLNYRLGMDYLTGGKNTVIVGFDRAALDIFPTAGILEGGFPREGEALIDANMKKTLSLETGDRITLACPDGTKRAYRVAGIVGQMPMLMKKDIHGLMLNTEDFRKILPSDNPEDNYDSMIYVKFLPWCSIRKEIRQIQEEFGIEDEFLGRNELLLATIGQSSDMSMLAIYLVAFIFAVLVAVAGILMIAGSMNSNIARRTEFFGLLRCLGASGEQVTRFVRGEALGWCRTAIPAGALTGIVTIWILCGALKLLSPTYFGEMPGFAVSWIGLLTGSMIGIVTVLMAAKAPAKKASEVSPLTAVSGNAQGRSQVKKAADTKHYGVETALGIHHAMGSRRNFFLMTCSFAFSIILFLGFTVTIDFMNHAVKPLKPWTPDISIISPDNTCSVGSKLEQEIEELEGVKRVYGRRFAYNIPIETKKGRMCAYLISYERHQFEWAEKSLVEGSLSEVTEGNGLLSVYLMGDLLKTGDTVTADFGEGERSLSVSGLLSECPFTSQNGEQILICSESTFEELTGESGYTILDIQMERGADESTVDRMRAMAGPDVVFSDQRSGNAEVKSAFYSFALFLYGFLAVIAMISVFNVINSIAMSVSARIRQYGAMRAVGMDSSQMLGMIAAEAASYGLCGTLAGCAAGLPLNWFAFEKMVTIRWGTRWTFPALPLVIIILVMAVSLVFAVYGPAKRIREMSIVDTIADR